MAIVIELQNEALNQNSDVLSLLRKALLVSRKLKLTDFESWVNNELNGYKNGNSIPDYREVRGVLKAYNPYNGWIPVILPDDKLEKQLCCKKIPDSIPSIQNLLTSDNTECVINMPAGINSLLNKNAPFDTQYILKIPMNAISNIIEQVKNKILDWSLILEENRILGEELRFTEEEKNIARSAPQIINYISNFHGDILDSQIQQGTNKSKQKQ
jgi:hypothetical protein